MAPDTAAAAAFYRELFGWTVDPPGDRFMGYAFAYAGARGPEHTVAGISPIPAGDDAPPPGWTISLATTDADATTRAVAEHGGTVIFPPHQMGELGRFAIYAEPGGAVFSVWEAGEHAGFGVYGEPGTFCWAEFVSRDAVATRDFLVSVFAMGAGTLGESEEFKYFQMKPAGSGEANFGVMQHGSGAAGSAPAYCVAYLRTDDVDDIAARVPELGGQVAEPASDSPFGRVATIVDPAGGMVKVIDPERATG